MVRFGVEFSTTLFTNTICHDVKSYSFLQKAETYDKSGYHIEGDDAHDLHIDGHCGKREEVKSVWGKISNCKSDQRKSGVLLFDSALADRGYLISLFGTSGII